MIIYKTTNLINGKIYVGQDSHNNLKYLGSGKILKKAIKKYGKENFIKETLEYCDTKDLLNEKEIFWIKELNTLVPNGYNISTGGNNGDWFTNHPNKEQIRNKLKEKRKLQIFSLESYKKISESLKGRKLSQETKQKISDKIRGIKRSQETKAKLSLSHKGIKYDIQKRIGRKLSEVTKQKLSREVLQFDLEGNFIDEYKSIKEAQNKIKTTHISQCCQNKIKSSGGFIWKYKSLKK